MKLIDLIEKVKDKNCEREAKELFKKYYLGRSYIVEGPFNTDKDKSIFEDGSYMWLT